MTAIRFPVPSIASVEKRWRAQYNTTDSGKPANRLARSNCFCTVSKWPDLARAEGNTQPSFTSVLRASSAALTRSVIPTNRFDLRDCFDGIVVPG